MPYPAKFFMDLERAINAQVHMETQKNPEKPKQSCTIKEFLEASPFLTSNCPIKETA